MKRLFLIVLTALLPVLCAHAVLKEKNLEQTLSILRQELTTYHRELSSQMQERRKQQEEIRHQLISVMQWSNQNALMLYSQKEEYVFDLTYACHEATEQYAEFQEIQTPFRDYIEKTSYEIARYDSLITSLQEMRVQELSPKAKTDRSVCLALATNIRNTLADTNKQFNDYIHYYDFTEERLKHLNDYAQKRYNDIQTSIFRNGGENYISILRNFNRSWNNMTETVEKKYRPQPNSQWDSKWIFGLLISIFIYAFIASIINYVFMRWVLPKRFRTDEFNKKRKCITMATTTVTFAIILGVMLATTEQNFVIMASNLLVEYAWLLGVILISLLLRVSGDQISSAFRIYTPLIVIGFIVIAFRIILIPNELVNMIFPPILLICMLWQWSVISRHNQNIPRSDMFYTYISLAVLIASVVCSWIGYTLLAVQMLIWWIMQLTCILTITCLQQYIKRFGIKREYDKKPITKTWFYNFIYQVAMPVVGIVSVMISIYWAADVFNLSDLCWKTFNYRFVDLENLKLSIVGIAVVVSLWFFFSYLGKTSLAFMRMYFGHQDQSTAESRTVMGRNVINVLVWGGWFLISLSILGVSSTWLVVISTGLSTGVGFAMKDIIENIYYGISLMAGRIKVGDWIEVDGTMGKVTSINYTSTTVNSLYGEVITFQNSQMFTKNYKNLTRNHGYVLALIPFNVAYSTDINYTGKIVEEAVVGLRHKWVDRTKPVKVVFSEFGESSINMKLIIWVDAVKKIYAVSDIMSCIYSTLGQNGIEIPFPQRDLHIKDLPQDVKLS